MACKTCGGVTQGEVGFTLQNACTCPPAGFATVDDVGGGLVDDLTCCVDKIRNLKTLLGVNQFEVMLIWTRWSGGERGVGEEYVYKEMRIEPTPSVAPYKSLSKELTPIGLEEEGSLEISEISPRYDEATMLGHIDGEPPSPDTNFYWEVRGRDRPGVKMIRRRFFPMSPPSYEPDMFQWTVKLLKADPDRTPEGLPRA